MLNLINIVCTGFWFRSEKVANLCLCTEVSFSYHIHQSIFQWKQSTSIYYELNDSHLHIVWWNKCKEMKSSNTWLFYEQKH